VLTRPDRSNGTQWTPRHKGKKKKPNPQRVRHSIMIIAMMTTTTPAVKHWR